MMLILWPLDPRNRLGLSISNDKNLGVVNLVVVVFYCLNMGKALLQNNFIHLDHLVAVSYSENHY